jgi:hypothetical protein
MREKIITPILRIMNLGYPSTLDGFEVDSFDVRKWGRIPSWFC